MHRYTLLRTTGPRIRAKRMYRVLILRLLFMAPLFCLEVWAVEISLHSTQTAIYPQSPLCLTLSIKLNESESTNVRSVYISYENIEMNIFDANGGLVAVSARPQNLCNTEQRHVFKAMFETSAKAEK